MPKIEEDAESKLKAISEGTFTLPVRGRKAAEPGATARKPKAETDKVSKLTEGLGISERSARLLALIGLNMASRRTKVTVPIFESEGPILASKIMNDLNEAEEKKFDMREVVLFALHLNYLFSRENQPWKVVVQDKEGGDKIIRLVSSPIDNLEAPQDQEPPESEVA